MKCSEVSIKIRDGFLFMGFLITAIEKYKMP